MTDNHWSYTHSRAVATVITGLGAHHELIKPHCPWQNGKVNASTAPADEWAYRQMKN